MNSFDEKKTYQIAIIIVIVGTLVITTGFAMGLLFLTESDNRVLTEDSIPSNIKNTEDSDFIRDTKIDSNDWIIPIEIPSRVKTRGARELLERELTSFDGFYEIPARDTRNIHNVNRGAWNRWILIEKNNFRLTLYNRDRVLREWKIAVGIDAGDKQRKGDNRTPNGTFWINQIQNSNKWTHDFGDGKGFIKGAYGPWFIRLYTPPWTGIGIHGTHDPDSLGNRISEGCIRMNNADISELKKMVKVGMPVVIVE
jgi:lipoprotein-anchoring transpeptidase ErfK/SrfK